MENGNRKQIGVILIAVAKNKFAKGAWIVYR